jgi:hypothetical protein
MYEVLKCLIVACVVLAPMWILASELDGDEFVKSAGGLAAGAVILTALKILENQFAKANKK